MSAPGKLRLHVRTPGQPDRWVAIGDDGRSAHLTTYPGHAYAASRESLEALSRKKAVRKVVPHDATIEAEEVK